MDTTTHHTITYGTAAHGGKVHQIRHGKATCLNGNGHKPIRMTVAEVTGTDDTYPTLEQRAAALTSAHVSHDNVCRKCAGRVADIMKEAGA